MNPVSVKKKYDELLPQTLLVDLSDNFGGANARILALIQKLPQESVGLATIEGSVIASELERAGYLVHRLANNKFDPRIPFRMAAVIRKYGYKVLDTQNPQSKLWGSIAASLSRVALISTLNSWYMNEHPKYSLRWFGYTVIELLTNVVLTRYIVVSREIQNAMLRIGIPADKIDLVYNSIDIDNAKIPEDKKELLEKYKLPENAIVCVAAGRLAWAKGHEDLINAVGILKMENQQVYCLIAGDGDLKQQLESQIQNLNLTDCVKLVGHLSREAVLFLTKNADLFVMPSRTEGTPVALLEAAILRTPILASTAGGIPELITNEDDGLLVPIGDVKALANGIKRLAKDKKLSERLVENAFQKVKKHFTLDEQANSTIQSYNKAWRCRRFWLNQDMKINSDFQVD